MAFSPAAADSHVALSSTFDDGTAGVWTGRGTATVEATTDLAHEGTHSLAVTGRTDTWHGTEADVTAAMTPGTTYDFSAFVRLPAEAAATTAKLTMIVEGAAYTDPAFQEVTPMTDVTADGWTELSGSYMVPADAESLTLYVEAADATASFYVDTITVAEPGAVEPEVVTSKDFEDETIDPWILSGEPELDFVDDGEGGTALSITRSTDFEGIQTPLGILEEGKDYTFSMRARLADGPPAPELPFTDVADNHPFYEEIAWMWRTGLTTGYADGTFRSLWSTNRDAMAAFIYRLVNGGSDPAPACTEAPFPDVPVNHPFCGEISWFKAEGLTTGYEDGTYRPAWPVARDAMAAFIYRFVNETQDVEACTEAPFSDVPVNHPFCGEIAWLEEQGITTGWPDGTFRPAADIERQAMAAFMFRGVDTGLLPPVDDPGTGPQTPEPVDVRFVVRPDFTWVGNTTVTDEWTTVSGTFTLPEGADPAASQVYIGIEGAEDVDITLLIDDLLITAVPSAGPVDPEPVNLIFDFEDNTLQGWELRQADETPATVAVTDAEAHGGTYAALVSDRDDQGDGIGYDFTEVLEPGATYEISAWVKMATGAGEDSIWLSAQTGPSAFATVAQTAVTDTEWTLVEATYTVPSSAEMVFLYFETAFNGGGTGSFLVDDIMVSTPDPIVIEDLPPIKDEFAEQFKVGVAIDERETTGAAAELLLRHFNQITAENHMKVEAWYDEEGNFRINPQAVALMDFAAANDLDVYGHVLLWHSQTPEWFFQDETTGEPLTTSDADKQILRDRLQQHIDDVAEALAPWGEYGADNPMVAWDVVNEVISDSAEFEDGLRRSEWYRILGEEFIHLAFEYADAAFNNGPNTAVDGNRVLLFINDYNTEVADKGERYRALVDRMLAAGTPIDGVGHQFHVSLSRPIADLEAAIVRFQDLDLIQAVTELDVTVGTSPSEALLIEQGYYYRDAFELFRTYAAELYSVTAWGLSDNRSWRSEQLPLIFDAGLQAKYAYYGLMGQELPVEVESALVFQQDVDLTAAYEDLAAAWARLPLHPVGEDAGFQLRWFEGSLFAWVEVTDGTVEAEDAVAISYGADAASATTVTVARDAADSATQRVFDTATGYVVLVELPLGAAGAVDQTHVLDVAVTDGATEAVWSQGEPLGVLTFAGELAFVQVPEAGAAPTIDAVGDEAAWATAPVVTTDTVVEGDVATAAMADVRTLWMGDTLYVYAEIMDDEVQVTASDPWVQDSLEIFVDAGNDRSGAYDAEDTQIRISAEGVETFGTGDEAAQAARVDSAATPITGGYAIEAAITLEGEGGLGTYHGLDFQVNDGDTVGDGITRTSITTWADPTGTGYQYTDRWGVAQLVAAV